MIDEWTIAIASVTKETPIVDYRGRRYVEARSGYLWSINALESVATTRRLWGDQGNVPCHWQHQHYGEAECPMIGHVRSPVWTGQSLLARLYPMGEAQMEWLEQRWLLNRLPQVSIQAAITRDQTRFARVLAVDLVPEADLCGHFVGLQESDALDVIDRWLEREPLCARLKLWDVRRSLGMDAGRQVFSVPVRPTAPSAHPAYPQFINEVVMHPRFKEACNV